MIMFFPPIAELSAISLHLKQNTVRFSLNNSPKKFKTTTMAALRVDLPSARRSETKPQRWPRETAVDFSASLIPVDLAVADRVIS